MPRGKRNAKGRFVPDAGTGDDTANGVVGVVGESIIYDEPAPVIDPAAVAGSNGIVGDGGDSDDGNGDGDSTAEQPRRKRGRPPGSGAKGKAGAYPLNVRGLEKLLVGIHGGVAMLLSSPGFALDTEQRVFDGKTEAEFLSQSVADVARHYNPKVFEQKTIDWSNLIQCVALVYGPRLYNMRAERKMAQAQKAHAPRPQGPPTQRPADPQPAANRAANGATEWSKEARTGEIPGIGSIEVPPDFLKN